MMIFYQVVHQAVQSRLVNDEQHRNIETACLLLVGLLSIAGYRGNGGCILFHEDYPIFQGYLKEDYKMPNKAMQAIVAAFSTPNITEYQKVLFACSEGKIITMAVGDEESFRKLKAKAKAGAREHFQQNQIQNQSAELRVDEVQWLQRTLFFKRNEKLSMPDCLIPLERLPSSALENPQEGLPSPKGQIVLELNKNWENVILYVLSWVTIHGQSRGIEIVDGKRKRTIRRSAL